MVTLVVRSKVKNAMLINNPLIILEVEDSGKQEQEIHKRIP